MTGAILALHHEFLQSMGIGWMAGFALLVILEGMEVKECNFMTKLWLKVMKEGHFRSFLIKICIALWNGEVLSRHSRSGQCPYRQQRPFRCHAQQTKKSYTLIPTLFSSFSYTEMGGKKPKNDGKKEKSDEK